jgi:hypothetical protein
VSAPLNEGRALDADPVIRQPVAGHDVADFEEWVFPKLRPRDGLAPQTGTRP